MLRGKAKLDIIEVVISKALINSHISYDKVVSVNDLLIECNEMKEEIKNLENDAEYTTWEKKTKETYCVSCKKNTANKNSSFSRNKQNRLMLASNFAFCGKKNSVFFKK